VTIRGCDIEMSDQPSDAPGIFFTGDDSFIEHNIIRVLAAHTVLAGGPLAGGTLDPDLFERRTRARAVCKSAALPIGCGITNNLIQGRSRQRHNTW